MVSQIGIATRSHAQRERLALPWLLFAASDVLVAFLAFAISSAIVFAAVAWMSETGLPQRVDGILAQRLTHFAVFVPVLVFWFTQLGHYRRGVPFWTEVQQILWVVAVAALLDGFSQYVSHQLYSRSWLVLGWTFVALLLITGRRALKSALLRAGLWQLPTVVVGSGDTLDEAIAALGSERQLGYEVVSRIDIAGDDGLVPSATDLVSKRDPRFVVIAAEAQDVQRVQGLVVDLHRRGMPFAVVPPLSGMSVLNMSARGFFSHDAILLTAPNNLQSLHARLLKRCFDVVVSSLLLILLLPLFAVIAVLVARDGAPVFYGQKRVGRGGRWIVCLKFRTMVPDADRRLADLLARDPAARAEWARDMKLRNDPRVTSIGRFLRRTSLDELPQLVNVVRGEMSLVGPRPIIAEEVPLFGEDIGYYYEVDPGITGLWQVSGRNTLDYARRVRLNSWYVRNWSLWHDVTILFRTVRVVLERDGAW
jgi:undecaprenyl-phosphate galactose phosphotransferase